MNDGMLAEKDDLAWGRDDDVALDLGPLRTQAKSARHAVDKLVLRSLARSDKRPRSLEDPLVLVSGIHLLQALPAGSGVRGVRHDGTSGNERVLEVVDQVASVFDADTQADQVLGKPSLGTNSGRNRSVTGIVSAYLDCQSGLGERTTSSRAC